jgi:hypothetical protein
MEAQEPPARFVCPNRAAQAGRKLTVDRIGPGAGIVDAGFTQFCHPLKSNLPMKNNLFTATPYSPILPLSV